MYFAAVKCSYEEAMLKVLAYRSSVGRWWLKGEERERGKGLGSCRGGERPFNDGMGGGARQGLRWIGSILLFLKSLVRIGFQSCPRWGGNQCAIV